jgi:hypothetical protein
MHKSQPGKQKKYEKNQGNMTPPKIHMSLITESKDNEMVEMPDK